MKLNRNEARKIAQKAISRGARERKANRTLSLKDDNFITFKAVVTRENRTVSEVVDSLIEAYLEEMSKQQTSRSD